MVPLIVGCTLFMQMLDSTVVVTALPMMAQSLHTTTVHLSVAITAYLLALAVCVPISGWMADRLGARRVFFWAIALFTLSSVACSMASTVPQLVLARLVQGAAGAMMVPVGRLILLRSVPKSDLLRAMSALAVPALLGPVIGPPLGGLIVTTLSWPWIFLINVPVGVLGLVLVQRYVPDLREQDVPPLDFKGFVLSSIALATLVGGFEVIGRDVLSLPQIVGLAAVGALSGLLYVRHAARHPHPLIDLQLLRVPTFAVSVLGGNLCRMAVGSVPFLLAVMLQEIFGFSALQAGLVTFASAAGALVMKMAAPPILRRWGYPRVLRLNAVLTGGAIMACALFSAQTPAWIMLVVLLAGGFFRSLQFTAVNTLTYADIAPRDMSRASTFAAMAQQLGISLGVGVAAATLNLSLLVRGAETPGRPDVIAGLLVVGAMCLASVLSFRALAGDAGASVGGKGSSPE
ncbi:DHA2 family efflux MFS transporter permease subunit [Amphibiibacter pelophylacis]|uniref:DHA2 family efflux MFS transporter permease subunit n=1 Tax=Amphibiibacter pelophylacis TaxID=1799477 RepID=UPI003BFA74A0